MKTSQLGEEEPAPAAAPAPAEALDGESVTLRVGNALGLHARPAGRIVAIAGEHDVQLSLRNATRDKGPADARSLTALAMLQARQGDEVEATASGPGAQAALEALRALADDNFGDPRATRPKPPRRKSPSRRASETGSVLAGARVAGGVVVGPVRRLVQAEPVVDDTPNGPPDEERGRLDAARAAVRAELADTQVSLRERGSGAEGEIFAAHAALLEDTLLLDPVHQRIADGAAAPRAWADGVAEVAASFRGLDDPYLRERAVDVEDVGRRVLAQLAGVPDAAAPSAPGILVADELTPGEVAHLDPEVVWAIAAARGGVTDHASIISAALGIPVVVGLGPALLQLSEGATVAVDGDAGTVERDPDEATVAAVATRRERAAEQLARAHEPVTLADGRRIGILANIGSPADVPKALANGAEGVGLLRTEFLFLDRRDAPSEDEQVETLTRIAQALDGRPLTVRTLDAGADKPLAFVRQPHEVNPYLGLRGLRLSLANPALFHTQLRAILRVAAEHPLKVMFPMVSTLHELHAARAALDAARQELGSEAQLHVGVMVEVPALALEADAFAPHVDFFSIGTNDLSQYTMAAERGNPALAALLNDALSPVLALIASVTAAAARHERSVSVCGELAGDPDAAARLVALGVSELSMSAGRIPALKHALRVADAAPTR